jgi:hypothetical protein
MQNLKTSDSEHPDASLPLWTSVSGDRAFRPDPSPLSLVDGDGWTEPASDGRPWPVRSMLLLAGGVSIMIWGTVAWGALAVL